MIVIGLLLPLAIVAGIVFLIVRAAKPGGGEGDVGESAGDVVRRLFQYALLFAGLMMTATGVIGLLAALLETDTTIARDAADVAGPLALTIVGGPLFAAMAMWTRRRLTEDPAESRSLAWSLYLTVTLLVALVAGILSLADTASWILGDERRGPSDLARACVWAVIWAAHWWVGERVPARDRLRTHRILGSVVTLWMAAGFLIGTIGVLASWVYDDAFRTVLVATVGADLRATAPQAVVAIAAWWWYWLRHARGDARTTLWHVHVLLVALLPAVVTTLGAFGVALFTALQWAFGDVAVPAADHFADLPGVLAAVVVAAPVVAYHRSVIRRSHAETRTETDRVYDYLVAAVGLISLGVGMTVLVVAAVTAVSPAPIAEGSNVDDLLAAVTFAIVGGPVWWWFWRRVQRHAAVDPVETSSTTRRLYLFLSFGAGAVAAVIALIVALTQALRDLLDGELGRATLYDVRVPLALVVTVGAIAGYHWAVFREDRARVPAVEAPRRIRSVVVIGATGDGLAEALQASTGVRPVFWPRRDSPPVPVDPAAVAAAVSATSGDRLVVVAGSDGRVEVIPVEAPSTLPG